MKNTQRMKSLVCQCSNHTDVVAEEEEADPPLTAAEEEEGLARYEFPESRHH
jgi:hypothetical protein